MTTTIHRLWGDPANPVPMDFTKPFDRDAYSRMKHGSVPDLKMFARQLVDVVLRENPMLWQADKTILLPVAYQHVEPACFHLANFMVDGFHQRNLDARVVKVDKSSVTVGDYAGGSAQDRQAEMDRIVFTLSEAVRGHHLVLVDDIRITGLAEKTMVELLVQDSPASITCAYIATVDPVLGSNPSVEKTLNHWSVKSILDMVDAISLEEFVLTIRFLKVVLGSDEDVVEQFAQAIGTQWCAKFVAGARGTGEGFVNAYRSTFEILERVANERR